MDEGEDLFAFTAMRCADMIVRLATIISGVCRRRSRGQSDEDLALTEEAAASPFETIPLPCVKEKAEEDNELLTSSRCCGTAAASPFDGFPPTCGVFASCVTPALGTLDSHTKPCLDASTDIGTVC